VEFLRRQRGPQIVEINIPYPIGGEDQVIEAVTKGLPPAPRRPQQNRLVILDHVSSPTALIFPVEELTALCHERGARVLIDGAHGPGMISIDLPRIDADYYAGNCHKWLLAPKGCGFLWARPDRQKELHPLVISHGLDRGYRAEFDWTGTHDPSAWLAVTAALEFIHTLGFERIRAHNHQLALEAGRMLAALLGAHLPAPEGMLGSMLAVELLGIRHATESRAAALHDRLLENHGVEVPVILFNDRIWVRISAQVYNELSDYQHLAQALTAELAAEHGAN
jgi:isopenicillin-N epimerase